MGQLFHGDSHTVKDMDLPVNQKQPKPGEDQDLANGNEGRNGIAAIRSGELQVDSLRGSKSGRMS